MKFWPKSPETAALKDQVSTPHCSHTSYGVSYPSKSQKGIREEIFSCQDREESYVIKHNMYCLGSRNETLLNPPLALPERLDRKMPHILVHLAVVDIARTEVYTDPKMRPRECTL